MSKHRKTKPENLDIAKKRPNDAPRGKNDGGQTNGQSERDPKRRTGNFTRAGDPPRMVGT